ncbi:MAG: N-acetylneuraminate synthase family protein [Acidimicrobiaceae bacterium]
MSTPFDSASLEFLTKNLGLKTIKIGSGELTNAPFLLEVAQCADKIAASDRVAQILQFETILQHCPGQHSRR